MAKAESEVNSRQARKSARLFIAEVLKLLSVEYDRELTEIMLGQERRLQVLEGQLMKRDGYVLDSVE